MSFLTTLAGKGLTYAGVKLNSKKRIFAAAALFLLGIAGIISAMFPDLGLPASGLEEAINLIVQAVQTLNEAPAIPVQ